VAEAGNQLDWVTGSEVDNDYFQVMRSMDGFNYEMIGTMEAVGNSTVATSYDYLDKTAPDGVAYYKLSIVDAAANATESNVISLIRGEVAFEVTDVYPIPTNDLLQVTYTTVRATDIEVVVYDITGKMVQAQDLTSETGLNQISLDVSKLSTGSYILSLNNGQEVVTRKFVK